MAEPLVTAVMVTGKSPDRVPLARAAVKSFSLQTWPNRELVILNTGERLFEQEVTHIFAGRSMGKSTSWADRRAVVREYLCQSELLLGELRNLGLQKASGDYIVQWDDDDWYHPRRIALQMDHCPANGCSLLRSQIRYSFPSNSAIDFAWRYRSVPGIPGSILHRNLPGLYYRPLSKAEDDFFIQDNFSSSILTVVENNRQDFSHLYLRFFHGGNTWDERHIMLDAKSDRWSISPASRDYLQSVLRSEYKLDRHPLQNMLDSEKL